MTVSTQVSRNEYTGNGATTQYDFTFRILDKSHLLVQTLDTSESIVTLTLGTDYTVTGVNRYNGGKVVLTSALPAGYKISIERSTPVTQEASIRNQGGFFPEIHEDAFDKLTMLVQQAYGWWSGLSLRKPSWLANYYDAQNNRIRNLRDPSQAQDAATKDYVDSADSNLQQQITGNFNRSLRVPESSISQLPSAQDRAWKGLGFDGAGQPKLQDPAGTGLWGYVPAIGSFEKGSLLTQRFEVLLWESTDEYWRWDGAMPKVVLPGSTPDTAGGRGKGKWLDVTDATLRSNLGSGDGIKWIGKCPSVSALRAIEPTYDGQAITLERTSASGPLVNAVLTYDASDSTTADDGYSVFVTSNGARWKTDVSKGVDIRLHESIKADGSNFGSVLNDIEAKEVQKIINAHSVGAGNRLIIVPAKFISGAGMELTADVTIRHCSLFYVVFKGDVTLNYTVLSGKAVDINNTYYYTTYGLSGWDIGLVVHQHTGCFKSDGGTIHIKGAMHDGIVAGTVTVANATSTAQGLKYGNDSGNDVSTNILNVRTHLVENVKCTGFLGGLDMTMKSTYLNSLVNYYMMYNIYGINNTIADVSNGGERITLENGVISNNVSHGINWGAISAGIEFRGVSIDYNGGDVIHMTYYGRGNRFNFTGQCWIEGWGSGCYVYNAAASGAWAASLPNHIFFGQGTYILPRVNSPITELAPCPIFYNRGNVVDYIYDNGMYVDFKAKTASKSQSLVELGSQNRLVIKRTGALRYPAPRLTSYKHSLNFGLYNFSGAVGANLKGATDAGTKMLFSTINNDAALTIVYGDTDTSDASTFTQAQEVNVTSTSTDARFIIQNTNVRIPVNNPDEVICGGITLNPAGITSGEMFVTLRLQLYRASDLSTQIGTLYGADVKVPDYSASGGDDSGLISLQCAASVPASAVAAYGGSIVAVPALSFVGAQGSYKIRLPAFWKD
ncbi:TPA: phage tail fiber protein [Klebsiella quasipneumoniae subsp. quasipneumoniae]